MEEAGEALPALAVGLHDLDHLLGPHLAATNFPSSTVDCIGIKPNPS